jgi:hypothetical protein
MWLLVGQLVETSGFGSCPHKTVRGRCLERRHSPTFEEGHQEWVARAAIWVRNGHAGPRKSVREVLGEEQATPRRGAGGEHR